MNARKILWLITAVLVLVLTLLALSILTCNDCGYSHAAYNATARSIYATNTAVAKLIEGTHAAQTATAQSPR
jgi:hypothetical protein